MYERVDLKQALCTLYIERHAARSARTRIHRRGSHAMECVATKQSRGPEMCCTLRRFIFTSEVDPGNAGMPRPLCEPISTQGLCL